VTRATSALDPRSRRDVRLLQGWNELPASQVSCGQQIQWDLMMAGAIVTFIGLCIILLRGDPFYQRNLSTAAPSWVSYLQPSLAATLMPSHRNADRSWSPSTASTDRAWHIHPRRLAGALSAWVEDGARGAPAQNKNWRRVKTLTSGDMESFKESSRRPSSSRHPESASALAEGFRLGNLNLCCGRKHTNVI
jgi:hypothetical protein